jgi:hypothetical protein
MNEQDKCGAAKDEPVKRQWIAVDDFESGIGFVVELEDEREDEAEDRA